MITAEEMLAVNRLFDRVFPRGATHCDGAYCCLDRERCASAGIEAPRPVTLSELKGIPELSNLPLLNRSRLSVQPVTEAAWSLILKLGGVQK